MDVELEKECGALGGLFQSIMNDLRESYPVWEDFGIKATKLHHQLKSTLQVLNTFLDALQRVADLATNGKGATRDIGTALTRIAMRHRSIENRLKTVTAAVVDCLVGPLHDRLEDWRKHCALLEKDHAKEYKRHRTDIKKRASDTIRLQKKARKGPKSANQRALDLALQDVNSRYQVMLEAERDAVRQALIAQRSQFCLFSSWLKPVLDGELALMHEATQLQEILDLLVRNSGEPYSVPSASEALLSDVQGLHHSWHYTPPTSPSATVGTGSSMGSRKSSFCSLSSSDSGSQGGRPNSSSGNTSLYAVPASLGGNSTLQPMTPTSSNVMSSSADSPKLSTSHTSSQDSGFTSQDTLYGPSTMGGGMNGGATVPSMLLSSAASAAWCCGNAQRSGSGNGLLNPSSGHNNALSVDDSGGTSDEQSTPSPSPSSATWPDGPHGWTACGNEDENLPKSLPAHPSPPPMRPNTISAVYETRTIKRTPLRAISFVPPVPARPTSLYKENGQQKGGESRPPSGRQQYLQQAGLRGSPSRGLTSGSSVEQSQSFSDWSKMTPLVPDFNSIQPDQVIPQPIYMNAADLHQQAQQAQTPSGFATTPTYGACGVVNSSSSSLTSLMERPTNRRPLSFVGGDDVQSLLNSAEFCGGGSGDNISVGAGYVRRGRDASLGANARQRSASPAAGGLVVRRNSISNNKPPPPLRRNSAITSATPNAPPVSAVRNGSHCSTPMAFPLENNYCAIIESLNHRFSTAAPPPIARKPPDMSGACGDADFPPPPPHLTEG